MLLTSGKFVHVLGKLTSLKLQKDVIGTLPLGVVALSGSLEVVGLLEIELENSGGEEVQE